MIKSLSSSLLCAAIYAGLTGSGHALNARTWVSGTGVDQAGCGPIANPCRSLQYARDNTASGGEIDVKDSADYGNVTITKAITIVGDGSLAGVLAPAGGTGILINAGANDAVVLRGLIVEGAKVAYNGIVFGSGGSLMIANCVAQGFVGTGTAGNGIWIRHTSGYPHITITGTTASYNQYVGIVYSPGGTGGGLISISGSMSSHNGYGMSIYSADTTTRVTATVVGSKAFDNTDFGFQFVADTNGGQYSSIVDSVSQNNGGDGVKLQGQVFVYMTRSVAVFNNGFDLNASGNGYLGSDKTNFVSIANKTPSSAPPF